MFSHSVWLYRISHFFLLVIFSCNYFVVCTISRCWFFQHFKENPLLEWVEFSKWTELCSLATNNLQTSFLIAAAQRDKKAFLSFMYNTAFNKGHTQSQLWVYRFSVALSFSHSLICQSPLPQVSIFLYMPTLCVYVFLAIFISLSPPPLAVWLCLQECGHHTLARYLTDSSFTVFQ